MYNLNEYRHGLVDVKYMMTGERMIFNCPITRRAIVLHRITMAGRNRAILERVDSMLGGWIEGEWNLSHRGNCWISNEAKVYGNAMVLDNALVTHDSVICGRAKVCHDAIVSGRSLVCEDRVVSNIHLRDNLEV